MKDERTAYRHINRGTGPETRTFCPRDGEEYGPGGYSEYTFCPYCGGDAHDGSHRVDRDIGEVFCDHTSQSTYRYCPNCGDKTTRATTEEA